MGQENNLGLRGQMKRFGALILGVRASGEAGSRLTGRLCLSALRTL
jgi:hypothetical protein